MEASASAPVLSTAASVHTLQDSPYAAPVGSTTKGRKKWVPPPGAFNDPDIPPRFTNPGPGRYNPMVQHACLSTKPRVPACRFGSEDRYKYYGPQTPLERTSGGMLGGMYSPQGVMSPGPLYKPVYSLTKSRSLEASFSVDRRDPGAVDRKKQASHPGPGMYNPTEDRKLSNKKNFTPGGSFNVDDRFRYLGEVDPASKTPAISVSPGPMYLPTDHLTRRWPGTTSFGGRGPGTMTKPPSLKAETPGPGTYTPMTQAACLSSKERVPSTVFGVEPRNDKVPIDSVHNFHGGKVIDMQNATQHMTSTSPGPAYKPTHKLVHRSSRKAVIGTARRFMAA